MSVHSFFIGLLHGVFGVERCLLCHEKSHEMGLCLGCRDDLKRLQCPIQQICPICGLLSLGGHLCGACQNKPSVLSARFSSYFYEAPIKQVIHAFKHQKQSVFSKLLFSLMVQHPPLWLVKSDIHAVVAMPLSIRRLHDRGFNQSALLANFIADFYKIPIYSIGCIERLHTKPQSTLKRQDRYRNVRGIFNIHGDVKNRNLLLIDDVVTTGATLEELASSLKKSGAGQIFAWTLSRPK